MAPWNHDSINSECNGPALETSCHGGEKGALVVLCWAYLFLFEIFTSGLKKLVPSLYPHAPPLHIGGQIRSA
jgi:hypothetical protein